MYQTFQEIKFCEKEKKEFTLLPFCIYFRWLPKLTKNAKYVCNYKLAIAEIRKSLYTLMHQSIPSVNSGQPRGFCTYFQPGHRDLYHLNCQPVARGSALLSIIISTKLSVDAVWRYIFNFKLIYHLFLLSSHEISFKSDGNL